MIKLVQLECPNCGGKVNRIDEDVARCPHCEAEFLIDEGQPENVIHIHEAEKKTPWGAIVAAMVILALIFGSVWVLFMAASDETDTTYTQTEVRKEAISSAFYQEFVTQVFGTSYENVTGEQLREITYIHVYSQDGADCVDYRRKDGELKTLMFSDDLYMDNADLRNFPDLKTIRLRYGCIPESILPEFEQLEELETENSPEGLALCLAAPEKLRTFYCHRNTSMAGMNAFENLEFFMTDYYETDDIRALASLKNLKTLIIADGDEISDYGALAALTQLEVLSLDAEQLKDISFVKDMNRLKEFTLKNSIVIDLSPLSEKKTLTRLTLEDNYDVKDYSVLSSLTELETLHLDLCTYGEMPDVSGFSKLTELSVSGADSLQFLSQLPTLKKLYLSGGNSSDFDVFAALVNLEELELGSIYGDLSRLDALAGLTELKKLDISGITVYGNVEDIFAIPGLEELNISDCSFGIDFDEVPENPNLKRLYMSRVRLWENIQVLQDGIVTYVDYDTVALSDCIDFVNKFPNLEELYLQGNQLTDVTFAESLQQLTKLDVTDNYITDLRPLQKLERLETVWCGQNSISQGTDLGEDVHVVLDSEADEGEWWR